MFEVREGLLVQALFAVSAILGFKRFQGLGAELRRVRLILNKANPTKYQLNFEARKGLGLKSLGALELEGLRFRFRN